MTWHLAINAQTIVGGRQALDVLGVHLGLLGAGRVALLASPSVLDGDAGPQVEAALGDARIVTRHSTTSHSPLHASRAIADELGAEHPDALLAVGGGSAIDTAKAVALLLANRPLEVSLGPAAELIPIVAVATTLAGAELTPAGALTDGGSKRLFIDRGLVAAVAIYDPRVLRGVPDDILATTGMNGLAHCLEAAYSLATNPVAAALASAGASRFAGALNALGAGDRSPHTLVDLQAAAVLGGLAIAAGSAGIHHAVCHVLGGAYGVAHGAANAAFLPYALAYNAEETGAVQEQLNLAMAAGGFAAPGHLPARIAALQNHLGIPSDLAALGISRDDLPAIAQATLEDPTSGFNPRPATSPRDLMPMLERAWSGDRARATA